MPFAGDASLGGLWYEVNGKQRIGFYRIPRACIKVLDLRQQGSTKSKKFHLFLKSIEFPKH